MGGTAFTADDSKGLAALTALEHCLATGAERPFLRQQLTKVAESPSAAWEGKVPAECHLVLDLYSQEHLGVRICQFCRLGIVCQFNAQGSLAVRNLQAFREGLGGSSVCVSASLNY